ncbi:MAG: response regulator [Xanthomonadales bacterium]|nr:response regulator [Xanthomonadales bacterium]
MKQTDSDNSRKCQKRLLIVDDDPSVRETLEDYFEYRGCRVRSAESVSEARHTLAMGFSPDVVISDWQLGGPETGAELVREIKRFKPNSETYLISGHSREEVIDDLGELEISGIYTKPLEIGDLARSIGL